ncbi:MAG: hypothetical protein KJO09_10335 [Gammaproteobacteria bacterium]|nr:hypothetical protein [Gammaproteobacteria bacterium]
MQMSANDINLVLIAENSARAKLLRDTMSNCGINGVIRRIDPGAPAVDCARQTGPYREKPLPDLFFLDFTDPSDECIAVLKAIAFGEQRTSVPVVLMTSDYSQDLLDNGDVAEDTAVMFSPTSLPSFFRKMKTGKRPSFFKALRTLYQYGPILVRPPESQMRTAAA